ncbi:arsenate-mycothiol transferase ArsC [Sphingobacterium mizutaii]|uniref:arsenate-mycothiol transferase ArsC n=1 Tax=Sphingobacterium mizutaii TaxID=1010 RepID=UPI00289AC328|nr:protein-tyrosine-phosphatase [Sphingobacterium mizutaii]
MNANLTNSINQLNWMGFGNSSRKETLKPLIDFIQHKTNAKEKININFICTHNSRRSHLSQIWAQTAAAYFNIPNVNCYSGGTEETSLFPTVVDTLKAQGFEVMQLSGSENPIYAIKYARTDPPIIGFSKKHDHPFNPEAGFAAIMTCSQADAGCPFIPGAEKRIPVTFEDPKVSDGSPEQAAVYASRSLQIAEEMFYVFSQIKAE